MDVLAKPAEIQPPQLEFLARIPSDTGNYYRVLQELGRGGNSQVYLVECIDGDFQGVLFALKLFIQLGNKTRLGRFHREVDFLINCDHPSIMKVYDRGVYIQSVAGENYTFPFVIADYLPQTLYSAMRSGLGMVEKSAFTLQLLSGLSFLSAGERQIVHRDIKPENIFVRGKACLLGDFGLMKILGEEDGEENDREFVIESTGPRLPRFYRTPDLVDYCREKGELTVKSDVFQLGLVFAEMFSGVSPLRPCKKILDDVELNEIQSISGSQGALIKALIERMLLFSVDERPFARDLMDSWEGPFLDIVNLSHQLQGRIF